MLINRDSQVITPAIQRGAATGVLNGLVMTNAASSFTEPIEVGSFSEAIVFLSTSAHGGTNPTLDCDVQYGYIDSSNQYHWVDSGDSFTQITSSTGDNVVVFKKLTANFGKRIRFRLKIGGTATPTYTVTMKVALKT